MSGEDGSFNIENLPAGTELEFQAWTGAGWMIDVKSADGSIKGPLKKGKFKLTLKPGENNVGEILVDPKMFN